MTVLGTGHGPRTVKDHFNPDNPDYPEVGDLVFHQNGVWQVTWTKDASIYRDDFYFEAVSVDTGKIERVWSYDPYTLLSSQWSHT